MEIEQIDSGYNNHQVVEGWMELYVQGIKDPISIDVVESTMSDVRMYLNFTGYDDLVEDFAQYKESVLNEIKAEIWDEEGLIYTITDESLISELFSSYGTNAETGGSSRRKVLRNEG